MTFRSWPVLCVHPHLHVPRSFDTAEPRHKLEIKTVTLSRVMSKQKETPVLNVYISNRSGQSLCILLKSFDRSLK